MSTPPTTYGDFVRDRDQALKAMDDLLRAYEEQRSSYYTLREWPLPPENETQIVARRAMVFLKHILT